MAGKGEFDQVQLEKAYDRIGEVPFTSERKRMSVVVQAHPEAACPLPTGAMFTKGSSA